ncbi:flavin monoamine oxidase family protein [Massilia sp. CFBP9026]|uniref:flavin monoamine oxidase family protein n=1 Tax=Massilia sp. CFBP9026 TaxID=3096536 RepID=UPI002A6B2B55|nr:flavin monoamine oxidase family protein [Massilia sp. CFBP9026]MDY0961260.1 flavin monoamine oxidase family protein [Massilia sp. CFBP9026]
MSAVKSPLTRRAFLYRAAAVGGSALLLKSMNAWGMGIASKVTAPPPLTGSGKGKKVAILGAGLAGLCAAYELRKLGYRVQVLEARPYAGGRCQTARRGFRLRELGGEEQLCRFDRGHYINHGPWRIPLDHQSTLHYAREFAVPLEVMVNENDHAWVYLEEGGPLSKRRLRGAQIKADMRGHVAELLAKSVQSRQLDVRLSSEDQMLLLDYLAREGALGAGDLAYKGRSGRGFATNPGAGLVPGAGTPSDPLAFGDLLAARVGKVYSAVQEFPMHATMFQPVGGMDRIPQAFAARLGDTIRYGAEVRRIRQDAAGVTIDLHDTASGQASSVKADYCLCTLPLSVLRMIDTDFSPGFKAALKAVPYAPVGKIGLQMGRRFWEEDDHIYGGHVLTDLKGINTISLPSSGWQQRKGVVLGYYNYALDAIEVSALSPAQRAEFALAAGEKIFPAYRSAYENAFSVAWHRVQYSLGGWAEWNEAARRDAYPLLLEGEGRVQLAGEHLSYLTGWQAGAIESAWQQIERLHRRASA